MRLLSVFALLVGLATGCGTEQVAPGGDEKVGQLFVPVSSTGTDGNIYTLIDGVFDISGPVSREVDGTIEGNLLVDLPFGEYQVSLRTGWRLGREDADGNLVPVDAVLASKNPATVQIQPGGIVSVPFEFLLGSDDGTLHVNMGVSDQVGVLTGRVDHITDMAWGDQGGTPNGFTGTDGQVLDFIVRFSQLGTFTGTMENGNKMRNYLTNGVYLRFPTTGSGVLVGEVLPRLTGSIGSIVVESISEFEGLASFVVSDFDPATGKTYRFSLYSFRVYATRDAAGFPVLPSDIAQDVRAEEAELIRFEPDAAGVVRLTGELTGESSVYVDMP